MTSVERGNSANLEWAKDLVSYSLLPNNSMSVPTPAPPHTSHTYHLVLAESARKNWNLNR